jgi:hypothetical protein
VGGDDDDAFGADAARRCEKTVRPEPGACVGNDRHQQLILKLIFI